MPGRARHLPRSILRRVRRVHPRRRRRESASRFMNSPTGSRGGRGSRRALALIGVFALARLAFAAALGLGCDESYTIVVARRLDWSYFDHPPLHQWIAHFAALAFGEGAAMRLPFVVLFAATGWLTFALTRRLFGARAGLIALVALNLTPFFFASAGSLGGARRRRSTSRWPARRRRWRGCFRARRRARRLRPVAAGRPVARARRPVEIQCGPDRRSASSPSSRSAPRQRHWLADPAAYWRRCVALVVVAPVVRSGTREHDWVSFRSRARAPAAGLEAGAGLAMALGEIALSRRPGCSARSSPRCSTACGARRATRGACFSSVSRCRRSSSSPSTPLWGAKRSATLVDAGLALRLSADRRLARAVARGGAELERMGDRSARCSPRLPSLVVSQAATGFATRLVSLTAGAVDPTLETLDWARVARAPPSTEPTFVVAAKWWTPARSAWRSGRTSRSSSSPTIRAASAFSRRQRRFVGHDAAVVVAWDRRERPRRLAPYFASLRPAAAVTLQAAADATKSRWRSFRRRLDARLSPAVSRVEPPRESRAPSSEREMTSDPARRSSAHPFRHRSDLSRSGQRAGPVRAAEDDARRPAMGNGRRRRQFARRHRRRRLRHRPRAIRACAASAASTGSAWPER